MLEQLLQLDTELFLYLNNLGNTSWDGFWLTYTTKINWVPFYALILYLLFKNFSTKQFLVIIVIITLLILFTDQITNVFKRSFERSRPCHVDALIHQMRIVREGCGGRFGFFSGHASNSMGLAFFIGLLFRRRFKYGIYVMVVWALIMGYSRIYVGVHYPLDVLCGMVFGAFSGFGFYKLYMYLTRRLNINS